MSEVLWTPFMKQVLEDTEIYAYYIYYKESERERESLKELKVTEMTERYI